MTIVPPFLHDPKAKYFEVEAFKNGEVVDYFCCKEPELSATEEWFREDFPDCEVKSRPATREDLVNAGLLDEWEM